MEKIREGIRWLLIGGLAGFIARLIKDGFFTIHWQIMKEVEGLLGGG